MHDKWERIVYVVTVALNAVSTAMKSKKILDFYFQWIKFKFFRPPGWYAGIAVTKNGSWSMKVVQCGLRNL